MDNEQENGATLMQAWGEKPYDETDEVENDIEPTTFPRTQQELLGFA